VLVVNNLGLLNINSKLGPKSIHTEPEALTYSKMFLSKIYHQSL